MNNFDNPMIAFMTSGIGMSVGVIVYIYLGLCLMNIGKKQGRDDGWMGFIPLANAYYMCVLAGYSGWLFLLFFIPIVNIVLVIMVWWQIAEKMGKPGWLSILMLIPFVNLIIPGIIAFS